MYWASRSIADFSSCKKNSKRVLTLPSLLPTSTLVTEISCIHTMSSSLRDPFRPNLSLFHCHYITMYVFYSSTTSCELVEAYQYGAF